MEPIIDQVVLHWLRQIADVRKTELMSSQFDIGRRIQYLTVYIISKLCLGQSFQCIENDKDQYDFLKTVKQATSISLQFTVLPKIPKLVFYLTKTPLFRRILVPSKTEEAGMGKIMVVSSPICQ